MKSVWDNMFADVRFWIGFGLMSGGTIAASYFYPVARAHPRQPNFAETFFEYALFTVAIGALSVLYKLYIDKTEAWKKAQTDAAAARRDRRNQEARDLREFRSEIIENYTAMKAFRRGVHLYGSTNADGTIVVPRRHFLELVGAFNAAQHQLESIDWRMHLDHRFLQGDEATVRAHLKDIRAYTHAVIDDCIGFDGLEDGPVEISSGTLWDFLQRNRTEADEDGPNDVNVRFFKPHHDLRRVLFQRIHHRESDVFPDDDAV